MPPAPRSKRGVAFPGGRLDGDDFVRVIRADEPMAPGCAPRVRADDQDQARREGRAMLGLEVNAALGAAKHAAPGARARRRERRIALAVVLTPCLGVVAALALALRYGVGPVEIGLLVGM